jgi:hypothetical protein
MTAGEHLAAARELASDAAEASGDDEPSAVTLHTSQRAIVEAKRHLEVISPAVAEASDAGWLRDELDRRESVITANRTSLAHVEAASEIVHATDEPEKMDHIPATMNAIIAAADRFPEAEAHLDAIPPSSPYANRASILRRQISTRQSELAAIKALSGPRRESRSPPMVRVPWASPSGTASDSYVAPAGTGGPKTVYVAPYTRKDGTPVQGHYRSAPGRK